MFRRKIAVRQKATLFLPSQNLQQFTNTVEVFRFINEAQENVIDLFSYEGAKS